MSLGVVGIIVVVAVIVVAIVWWRRRARAAILIAAEPEAALLSSAAALRRLGARITRYDGERGTLEARVGSAGLVRLRADPEDDGTTRVRLEGDSDAGGVIRRFRRALTA